MEQPSRCQRASIQAAVSNCTQRFVRMMVLNIFKMNQRYCSWWWRLSLQATMTPCSRSSSSALGTSVARALNACWGCRETHVYLWNQGKIEERAQTCWWRMEDGEQRSVTWQSSGPPSWKASQMKDNLSEICWVVYGSKSLPVKAVMLARRC